jgi:hypothetical protein
MNQTDCLPHAPSSSPSLPSSHSPSSLSSTFPVHVMIHWKNPNVLLRDILLLSPCDIMQPNVFVSRSFVHEYEILRNLFIEALQGTSVIFGG